MKELKQKLNTRYEDGFLGSILIIATVKIKCDFRSTIFRIAILIKTIALIKITVDVWIFTIVVINAIMKIYLRL